MKYILIILVLLISIGCLLVVETITVTETVVETVTVTEYIEVENTDKIDELESELQQYRSLIANLNELLGYVYYGYASNEDYILDGFTAFSMIYNDNTYIITAGHVVEQDGEVYTNHKFKANFSDEWIYPELIAYEYTPILPDYAIFYCDKIEGGFEVDANETEPNYTLGTIYNDLNVIMKGSRWGKPGTSGSPIVDLDGEVIAIHVGCTADIDIVLNAINNLN